MTLKEYKDRMKGDPEWAPGWLAIDEALDKLYPNQEPAHFGPIIHARLGGDKYLDGVSIYRSDNGYCHLVSYGMSALYADAESFGGEWSGWGYEMTMKLSVNAVEDCQFALNMMNNLAQYTYTSKRFFEPYQYVEGKSSIHAGRDSRITSLLCVPDTELPGVHTVHGRLDFIQLVGITGGELNMIKEDHTKAEALERQLRREYPHLQTDLDRLREYIL